MAPKRKAAIVEKVVVDHDDSSESESEASDAEDFAGQAEKIALGKVRSIAKKPKMVVKEAQKGPKRGVIYLGHVPFGFFEDQLRGFFAQFGDITNLKLSRNKKTGRSKHYAFIEFSHASVADIVAKAMDGYLMLGRKLVCKVVPEDRIYPHLFTGTDKKFVPEPTRKLERERQNSAKTAEQVETGVRRLLRRETKRREQLKALGIEYDFEGFAASAPAPRTHTHFEEEPAAAAPVAAPVQTPAPVTARPTKKPDTPAAAPSSALPQPAVAKGASARPLLVNKKTGSASTAALRAADVAAKTPVKSAPKAAASPVSPAVPKTAAKRTVSPAAKPASGRQRR